jgi:3-methyladenine DNA glycosylase AlkD
MKSGTVTVAAPLPAAAQAIAIIGRLRALRNERNIAGMRRFGIVSRHEQLGVSVATLREIGRPHRRDHALALALWASDVLEAKVLAAIIDDPSQVTPGQMERWVRDCDNWALTDALGCGLFDRTPFAGQKALAWSARQAEFVKRAGFALMAGMAVHRKELPDEFFLRFLPVIAREATDERNFVRKAVNWALRQIGKRNPKLRRAAIATARRIRQLDSRPARWIATDALRELTTAKPRPDLPVGDLRGPSGAKRPQPNHPKPRGRKKAKKTGDRRQRPRRP